MRLANLQLELGLLVKREETLMFLATSPYSPYREEAQQKLRALWERIETIQLEIAEISAPAQLPPVPDEEAKSHSRIQSNFAMDASRPGQRAAEPSTEGGNGALI